MGARSSSLQQNNPKTEKKVDFLAALPDELAMHVLIFLRPWQVTATALVSKRWFQLSRDSAMWRTLCVDSWHVLDQIYYQPNWVVSFQVMLAGCRLFDHDAIEALRYLADAALVPCNEAAVAHFLHANSYVAKRSIVRFLGSRRQIMEPFVRFNNWRSVFIGEALRSLLSSLVQLPRAGVTARNTVTPTSNFLDNLFYSFAMHYKSLPLGEPYLTLGGTTEAIQVLCFALLLLSVDLYNPRVKSKMSKREFLRSTRGTVQDDLLLGRLYDHVYMFGPIYGPKEVRDPRLALRWLHRRRGIA